MKLSRGHIVLIPEIDFERFNTSIKRHLLRVLEFSKTGMIKKLLDDK